MSRGLRLALVGLLLLPWSGTARAAQPCAVQAPPLAVDLARACAAVRAVVPRWDGSATVLLAPGDPDVAGETSGDVVTLHAQAWSRLTPQGRQVVLTHELVHVATAAITTARTPPWLVEGLADTVAWRGTHVPDRLVAAELVAALRRQGLPAALPTTLDAVGYEESWLAVDLLARRYGDRKVLRLYRAAGSLPLDRALAPLHLTVPQLTALWRTDIRRRLS